MPMPLIRAELPRAREVCDSVLYHSTWVGKPQGVWRHLSEKSTNDFPDKFFPQIEE